ncbi:MAG: hypothetical protein J0I66_05835, partial [Microbacterium sp.]|nr:hypothetical protein [Microbacterium sp.]
MHKTSTTTLGAEHGRDQPALLHSSSSGTRLLCEPSLWPVVDRIMVPSRWFAMPLRITVDLVA